jgi:hypothetical protein
MLFVSDCLFENRCSKLHRRMAAAEAEFDVDAARMRARCCKEVYTYTQLF